MYRLMVLIVIAILFTSCTSDESNFKDEKLEILNELDVVSNRVTELEILNGDIMESNKALKEEVEFLKKSNDQLSSDISLTYRDALEFRKDIVDIFAKFESLKGSDEIEYFGIDYVNDFQKKIIAEAIEVHFMQLVDMSKTEYEVTEYIGDKPSPHDINKIIGIVESEPKFYLEGNEEKTHHFDAYYYSSIVWTSSDVEAKPLNYFRGPFAGVQMLHIVIEEIDGVWKVVYLGLG